MSNLQTMRNSILKLFAALILSIFSIGGAYALPTSLSGQIGFGGSFDADTVDVKDATLLTFNATFVTAATGSFSSDITPGDSATFNTLDLDPFSAVTPFWEVAGASFDWSFDLNTINNINRSDVGFLEITGSGILHVTDGFDTSSTFGLWTLSADDSDPTVDDNAIISFSSTTSVPEPASIALLGLGLLGFAGLRRRVTS